MPRLWDILDGILEAQEREKEIRLQNSESKRYIMEHKTKHLGDINLKILAQQDRKERRKRKKAGIPLWAEC